MWLLWRQQQCLLRHGRAEPTRFFPSGTQSSFIKTLRTFFEGSAGSGVTLQPQSCSATRTGLLIPSETEYRGVGSPEWWGCKDSWVICPTARPHRSAPVSESSPLPHRDGDPALGGLQNQGLYRFLWCRTAWPGAEGLTAVPAGLVRPKCLIWLQTSRAAAHLQRWCLSAARLTALLSGTMKCMVGQ